ncbi:MAG: hypothetical protein IT373_27150 [Polyangiaceae bacterium]|nr:hypothetical protein [Polyangiaceae bacterium]
MRASPFAMAALLVAGCEAFVGDYQLLPEVEPVSSGHLCAIERDRFVFALDLGSTTAQPDLETYYELANVDLISYLTAIAEENAQGTTTHRRVTYLMGAAGVGKSFATRNVLDGFAPADQCEIKLSDLFYGDAALLDFEVVPANDLEAGDGLAFNELPSMADPATLQLSQLFDAAGCAAGATLEPLVIIDDLDEVHDEVATMILRRVDEFILAGAPGAGAFVHFLVVGRPEGFSDWLTDPHRTEENNAILDMFTLAAPRYQTAGDLDFRVRGYLDFSNQLADLEATGGVVPYVEAVIDGVEKNPFLTYSMGNLAVGNVAIEHTRPGTDTSEQVLKPALFDDVLQRAGSSHGRPEAGDALGPAYLRLLEDIAARYVDVDDDGGFSVPSEDRQPVFDADGTALGEVQVRQALNHAGVAYLLSVNALSARYRFDPFWLHAHLVERFNQRTVPNYTYRTCE